ncbi:cytochrome c3 family protein [Shewanella youngdeokensis]|uniref:Cytochrome c3 family protein n=1 Tax=Shewanella youngdeokensis TaxID=2999068 RepID=A0ABZ0K0Z0_9GAMM|nr:cytochrome c3 family protein [Shewanella sp. DAU334]
MKKLRLHNIILSLALSAFASGVMADDSPLLDETHAAMGMTCNDCHVSEKREPVKMSVCTECHDTQELADSTKDFKPTNPHDNRHFSTETDCMKCHKQHTKSVNYCSGCHKRFDFVTP